MGLVTKERHKYSDMNSGDPSTFKLARMKESIKKVNAKREELDRLQAEISEYADDINEEDEAKAVSTYEDNVDATLELITELMDMHKLHVGINHLRESVETLARVRKEFPDRDHTALVTRHSNSFEQLQRTLDESIYSSLCIRFAAYSRTSQHVVSKPQRASEGTYNHQYSIRTYQEKEDGPPQTSCAQV